MTKKHIIQLFSDKKVRTVWDEELEKWFFSIVDVCGVLTDSDYQTARKYWKVLKGRLKKEGNETVTNCYQLKMKAPDGKMRLTDVADFEQLFRLIQSIPSPKAEPFKRWMAEVAAKRVAIAREGGDIAGDARVKLERKIGRSIVTKDKASDYLPPTDRWKELPEENDEE